MSIGDVSLKVKKPVKPELVPVKYSKHLDVLLMLQFVLYCSSL